MKSAQQRGFEDGMSGAAMAGESPEYGEAFQLGRLRAAVESGRCMVSLTGGCRCQACGTHFIGDVAECGCDLVGGPALVRGAYVMSGAHVSETGYRFMDAGELRALIATGLPLLDMDGADISCQIQLPQ